jgi:subtilisin family serine protease
MLSKAIFFFGPGFLTFFLVTSCSESAKSDIKVMVIDTGIEQTHKAFENRNIECENITDCLDAHGHGTHVASLVINGEMNAGNMPSNKVCKEVTLVPCNYLTSPTSGNDQECLKKAIKQNFYLINFSSSGKSFDIKEYRLIKILGAKGTLFVTATGNDALDLSVDPMFPAMYMSLEYLSYKITKGLKSLSNVIAVGGVTHLGFKYDVANTAPNQKSELAVDVNSAYLGNKYKKMSGTSMATALYSNKLLKKRCQELSYE